MIFADLRTRMFILVALAGLLPLAELPAQQPAPPASAEKASAAANSSAELVPLNPSRTVLLDKANKQLHVRAEVVFRDGLLEMLACLKQTKEHESILAVDAKAYVVHAGLVAMGLDPGSPVQFQPEFRPPQGPRLKIELVWKDKAGKSHRAEAQEWVQHVTRKYFSAKLAALPVGVELPDGGDLIYDDRTQELLWYGVMSEADKREQLALSRDEKFRKAVEELYKKSQIRPMKADWVFAGSRLYTDAEGRQIYEAEAGDLICVANFASATIDVAMASSAGNDDLTFETATDKIPPQGTPVTIIISPMPVKK